MGSKDIYWKRHHRARLTRDLIRADLLGGRWRDTKLPSEAEMAERYAASRNAVREALELLVDENLLKRIHGYGTVSQASIVEYEVNHLQSLSEQGDTGFIEHDTVTWAFTPAPATIAEVFGVDSGTPVMLWERITMSPVPVIFWSSYLNPRFEYSLPQKGLGTYSFFEYNNLEVELADFRTGAIAADPSVAQFLDIESGSPTLFQTRFLYRRDGTPLEVCSGYFRSDRIVLATSHRRSHAERNPGELTEMNGSSVAEESKKCGDPSSPTTTK